MRRRGGSGVRKRKRAVRVKEGEAESGVRKRTGAVMVKKDGRGGVLIETEKRGGEGEREEKMRFL
jgi:hypothetical protein